jgi:hypothetical protein
MSKTPSKLGTEAQRVPLDVRRLVLHEAGYKCSNPACRYPLTLDVHHLYYVSKGGSGSADNLLPLCPNCHTEHHNGNIPTESLRAWKMLLMALNEGFDRRSIDVLLTIEKLDGVTEITGDGLPTYAPLIASNLVTVVMLHAALTGHALYRASLTERGKLFVEGWRKGDQRAAIELIPAAGSNAEPKGQHRAN